MDGDPIQIDASIAIPREELDLRYARSSGPGGQNVNKVASKAVLRFDLRRSPSLPETARQRALSRLANRITRGGELVLSCDTYRDQPRNRDAVLRRFQLLLAAAVAPPRIRRRTKPSRAVKEQRLSDKKRRSSLKRDRRSLGE
jgi:ribosome-associated protein